MLDLVNWEIPRVINFVILVIAFLIMIYKGVIKMVVDEYFDWDRFTNLCWTVLSIYGIGEVLFAGLDGGLRVFLATGVSLLQLWVVLYRYGDKHCRHCAIKPCEALNEKDPRRNL